MAQYHLIGFLVLMTCCFLEISSRPSNNEASVQYLPFYGGGKGQYLEVKKDNSGVVVAERIVSEDKVSSENIIKAGDENENTLSRVLTANLQTLKSQSNSLLRLHNQAKKKGLKKDDESRFKTQLQSLAETASNTMKLVDEIGEDVTSLYRTSSQTDKGKREFQNNYEDVGEEGIGIDADDVVPPPQTIAADHIAEAKPVGLAVVGENGIASSRPIGTAIAASGVAIARPVGTAIAGLDPTQLGLHLQLNKP